MPTNLFSGCPSLNRQPAHNLFFVIAAPRPVEEDIPNLFARLRQHCRVRFQ